MERGNTVYWRRTRDEMKGLVSLLLILRVEIHEDGDALNLVSRPSLVVRERRQSSKRRLSE